MPELILYHTSACHLCEQAELVLEQADCPKPQKIDIAGEPGLLERYGIRIPVLAVGHRQGALNELDWPFDEKKVRKFLSTANLNKK